MWLDWDKLEVEPETYGLPYQFNLKLKATT